MSSPLSAKRRKLNNIAAKLSKPFVSPLKTTRSDRAPLRDSINKANVANYPYIPSALAHTIKSAFPAPEPVDLTPASTAAARDVAHSSPARKQPAMHGWNKKRTDPQELAAQKAITSLEMQIRKVQNDLDSLKQAKKLSNSSTDADLSELSDKWRLACQAVAEELFGSVKERVYRMGGVAAWREIEKRKHDLAHGMGDFAQADEPEDDADCEFDSQGEELPEDEQKYRKKMKHQARREMLEAADVPDQPAQETSSKKDQIWQEDGKDDDTFTIDMMLRSLNIDLNLIGYDKVAQRWVV